MARDFARTFYKSKAWNRCRQSYIQHRIQVDGGLCEVCHKELGYIVHHKVELTPANINDPSIALGFFNMQYVCHKCHNEIHGVFTGDGLPDIEFDAAGDPIPPIKKPS